MPWKGRFIASPPILCKRMVCYPSFCA
jgi:hypothetical protein